MNHPNQPAPYKWQLYPNPVCIPGLGSALFEIYDGSGQWTAYTQDKAVAEQIIALRARCERLEGALEMAINTVECDSLDKDGNPLPWYRAAKNALAQPEDGK